MRKLIIISMLCLLTACTHDEDNYISEHTKEVMENREVAIYTEADTFSKEESISADGVSENVNVDNYKHSGLIDCLDVDECITKANIVKEKLGDIIDNVFYLEVKDDNNKLGYFIEYSFKEHTYEDNVECLAMGANLKELLKTRDLDFTCLDGVTLKVMLEK